VRVGEKKQVGPLLVPITTAVAAPLKFDQKKATISLVRLGGPLTSFLRDWKSHCDEECLISEGVTVGTRGDTPDKKSTLLSSDTGGSAKVSLEREDGATSHLGSSEVTRHGTYDGTIVLDPDAEKPRSISVTVKARDFLLWPLLALLAGVWLAKDFLRRRETARGTFLLRRAIKESVDPYLEARKRELRLPKERRRPERFYLNHLLPTTGPPYPQRQGRAEADTLPDVSRLYCEAATADRDEALTEVSAEVQKTLAEFDRWSRIQRAAELAWSQVRRLEKTERIR